MTDILSLDCEALASAYRDRTLSPREAVGAACDAAERWNAALTTFRLVDRAAALDAARASEARFAAGAPLGPLDGIPFTVKDNVLWQGRPTRRGSRTTDETPAAENAPAVDRLIEAGAIPFAKTVLPEFGWKGLGDSPLDGPAKNPWDSRMTTGGSSAGAAAAAALGIGPLHIGTDGAGSIRIPASFCGVFGIKPSYGRVPGPSALPLRDRLPSRADHARRAGGCRHARRHRASRPARHDGARDRAARLPRRHRGRRRGPAVRLEPAARLRHPARFRGRGADGRGRPGLRGRGRLAGRRRSGLSRPDRDPAGALADGRGLGARRHPGGPLGGDRSGLPGRGPAGAAHHRRAIRAGRQCPRRLYAATACFHESYDLLLTPTLAIPAFTAGHDTPPDGSWGSDWLEWTPYSYPFNLTLQPAATVPCGFTKTGLPVGLQIVGPMGRDDLVLRAARAFERARPWPKLEAPRVR